MAMGGVMMFFLGLLLCANRWVPLLLKGVGALVAHVGPASTIATANIQKNPRRVAATSTALLIGVALVSTLGTGAASARQTLASELDARYSVDIRVSGEDVDQTVLDDIRKVAGIRDAELIGSSNAVWHTDDYDSNLQVYTLTAQQGRAVMNGDAIDGLRDGVLLIPDALAGDSDDYPVRDGSVLDLELNATYNDDGDIVDGIAFKPTVEAAPFRGVNTPYGIYGLMPPDTLDRLGAKPDGYEVWAKTDGTVTPADVIDDIQQAVSSIPGITVGGSIAERVSRRHGQHAAHGTGGPARRGRDHRADRRGQHAVPVRDRTHPRIGHAARHRHDARPAAALAGHRGAADLAGQRRGRHCGRHRVRLDRLIHRVLDELRLGGVPDRLGHLGGDPRRSPRSPRCWPASSRPAGP